MTDKPNVVARVAALLGAVGAAEPAGASTTEVGRVAALARPTAHRLLSSLAEVGLIDRDAKTGGRWLLGGPEMYLLGAVAANRYDVTDKAREVVARLAAETGESAFFSARRGDETVCLLSVEGSFPLRSHVLREASGFPPLGVASAGAGDPEPPARRRGRRLLLAGAACGPLGVTSTPRSRSGRGSRQPVSRDTRSTRH